jgi:hypothetical protein
MQPRGKARVSRTVNTSGNMPPHRYTQRRRTPRQVRADTRAEHLATLLGRALLDGRRTSGATQEAAAGVAGISQSCWSDLERGRGASVSLRVWIRAASAVNSDLRAYLESVSATTLPRDAVHLRHQELVASTASRGGWSIRPEQHVGGAGVADLILRRRDRTALIEIWNWLADVGDAFRSWDRKLERLKTSDPGASGCWAIRATRRNRQLVADHRTLFAARFPGSAVAWMRALQGPNAPMPDAAALLWVSVRGDRLIAARR